MRRLAGRLGIVALGGVLLAGCTTEVVVREQAPVYAPPVVVEAPPPEPVPEPAPPAIVIYRVDDFYAPLSAYGRWDDVPGVGHCWIPTQVGPDWRPYTQGHWERTDAGWYWASDEPWGWATCHYGRWDWRQDAGWYWAPDVQWAPAWVSWRNGGGYVGWAPLPPAARFEAGAGIQFDVNLIPQRSFCFVPEAHFTEPVRSTTVIVNNITIINKTVNITNIRVVNKTIINEGPPPQRIEQATGHPVQVVRAAELRQKLETRVAVKPKSVGQVEKPRVAERPESQPAREATPIQEQPRPVEKPPVATREEKPVEKPKPVAHPEEVTRSKPTPEEKKVETRPAPKPPVKKPVPAKKEEGHPREEKPSNDKPPGQ